ncbi:glycerophosphodiester phosphodiesterase [Bacillus sp. FJAT-42376]|uniref:glycerophosphodiester phosphodiesterase n=1 Tax=Bacillus sp. FJAT-42376 TaxID=2014076 RepID=UPI000F4DF540|nr:glycerophosphodiester phosphodiesterase [Bacillus sp. FJAT-42376]AZB44458.1 glycerophosphodiester phosphodiesterase [Bacillus sp. FJAT-42376]
MDIYAHRGYSGRYPENTMLAFLKAQEAGAHGIELDVQMTKDGELVVIHDERIDRTTNGIGYVKDLSYSEISKADAGSWFHPDYYREAVPHLEEVLNWFQDDKTGMKLNIELKNDVFEYPMLEEKVMKLADEKMLTGRIVLSSFNEKSVGKIKKISDRFEAAWLFEKMVPDAISKAGRMGADCIHCPAEFAFSKQGREYMESGRDLRVYTINDTEMYRKLIRTKVAAVMTDFPDLLMNQAEA